MKLSIRDLMFVTVIVALATGWWVDRSRLRKEVQRVEFRLTIEEDRTKILESLAKAHADVAKIQGDRAAFIDDQMRAPEATRPNFLGPAIAAQH